MTDPNVGQEPGPSPRDISHANLPFAEDGGYEADAVRRVLAGAADQLAAAQAQILQLRADAKRNHQDVRMDVTEEAVSLLSRAQVMADKHVSDAEQYAHDLIETARKQYSEMLQKARDSVSGLAAAEESAAGVTSGGSGLDYSTPIQEIEYVRTYTKVAQVQLRAVIDALAEQVDQLGQLPGFGTPPPEAPPSGEPKDNGA